MGKSKQWVGVREENPRIILHISPNFLTPLFSVGAINKNYVEELEAQLLGK